LNDIKANQIAHKLINKGVGADKLVPVFIERNLEHGNCDTRSIKGRGCLCADRSGISKWIALPTCLKIQKPTVWYLTSGACVSLRWKMLSQGA
jgi:hypothetical protein